MDYEKINQLNAPFFSIIIPVYNGLSHDLSICLDSIWTQPIDASLYEVICVDDCSIDGTCYWLNEQTKLHSNLVVIRNSVNIRQGGVEIEVLENPTASILHSLIKMITIM